MLAELVKVQFDKIMQTRSYTVVVLMAAGKKFAIYTDPSIGQTLQVHLTGANNPRPQTHDLIKMMFAGLDVKVLQVVINDLQDTIYFARLFVEQQHGDERHIVEIDARPSDGITLAIIYEAPVYVTQDVLDRTIPLEE